MLNFFRYLQLIIIDYGVSGEAILYYRQSPASRSLLSCQHGLLSIVHLW